jgi:hypothetical protein
MRGFFLPRIAGMRGESLVEELRDKSPAHVAADDAAPMPAGSSFEA